MWLYNLYHKLYSLILTFTIQTVKPAILSSVLLKIQHIIKFSVDVLIVAMVVVVIVTFCLETIWLIFYLYCVFVSDIYVVVHVYYPCWMRIQVMKWIIFLKIFLNFYIVFLHCFNPELRH